MVSIISVISESIHTLVVSSINYYYLIIVITDFSVRFLCALLLLNAYSYKHDSYSTVLSIARRRGRELCVLIAYVQ